MKTYVCVCAWLCVCVFLCAWMRECILVCVCVCSKICRLQISELYNLSCSQWLIWSLNTEKLLGETIWDSRGVSHRLLQRFICGSLLSQLGKVLSEQPGWGWEIGWIAVHHKKQFEGRQMSSFVLSNDIVCYLYACSELTSHNEDKL